MSKPATTTTTTTTTTTPTATTNTTKPANTTTTTNTTKPVTPVVPVTPVAPATPPPAPASSSYAAAPAGNWIPALIGYIWVFFVNYLYLGLIAWWWIPISAILFGNWTDFYMFFISNSASFG